MTDNTKYPPNIQKLFAPKPPLPYIEPIDYAVESRKTRGLSSLSSVKERIASSLTELAETEAQKPPVEPSRHQIQSKLAKERRKQLQNSFTRQIHEWNDPELLQKSEKEFMKDPYRTVFVSRLDYRLTEIELSKHFSKYGVIESIRIIRDQQAKSRGYGFIVYEKDSDASNCVNDLARTGLQLPIENSTAPTRSILVDIERGRIIRNWKPRRLGGGLGGRHYTKHDPRNSNTASAAASGRRVHIANNPHFSSGHSQQSPSHFTPTGGVPQSSYRPSIQPPKVQYPAPSVPQDLVQPSQEDKSLRDKYAKYASRSEDSGRSIRNIRRS